MMGMRRRRWLAVVVGVFLVSLLLGRSRTARALVRYARDPQVMQVPVSGVSPRHLSSSFGEPRSEHRRHEGIDILAPRGTPVVSATAGEVVRVGQDRLGGNVVWVAGEGMSLFYYAHLDRFRAGLAVGDQVAAGTTLGFVGTTGNAASTPPHLHFGIYSARRGFRAVDPFGVLQAHGQPPAR
jgi:murein DD-endopeptidase MepM/ murein hydrolase activator NlpD